MRWGAISSRPRKERDILLTLGNEAAIASVVSGERPVSWGVSGYRAIEAKAEGSPIELIVWDEGLALAQFIGVVPAKAPHPNAARLLLRWLMTPEGQELLVKNVNQYSARKDVAITPLIAAAALGSSRSTRSATRRSSTRAMRSRSSSTRPWGCRHGLSVFVTVQRALTLAFGR